ncbi:MAG: 2-amino-4-hydroxy-6-hydroxymethyldihydropteridine diphosphokinase [Lautropia sp.]
MTATTATTATTAANAATAAAPTAPAARPTTAFIGLGANLDGPAGPPLAALGAAIAAIDGWPDAMVTGRSRVYLSEPVDAIGPPFCNQALRIALQGPIAADPALLLDRLHAIERRFGRVRSVRNAPRPLDLDLLLFGDTRVDTAGLQLPHPRLHQRRFVLLPLADIDAGLAIPGHGSVRDCIATLAGSGQQLRPL